MDFTPGEQVERWFKSELLSISNIEIRKLVHKMLYNISEMFWDIPASSTGKYHPTICRGKHGTVIHTKLMFKFALDLFQLYNFDETQKDCILAAIILHDSIKQTSSSNGYTVHEHPILAANFFYRVYECSEKTIEDKYIKSICGMIESHMGKWITNRYSKFVLRYPGTEEEKFVHLIDYIASRGYIDINIEELNLPKDPVFE